jgi:hypothetical protein
MLHQIQSSGDIAAPVADRPHIFQETEIPPVTEPLTSHMGGPYTPPPVPPSPALVCALCRKPREDRIHIAGEAEADAESPRWGL